METNHCDSDGNMTSDETWSFVWKAENRSTEVQPLVTNFGSTLVQYMYDSQSRRIARREFAWNDYLGETTWHYVQGRAFRYDDWNLLQKQKPAIVPRTPHPYISQTNLTLTGIDGPVAAQYVWGLDLSETLHGAGGVGGLLMQQHSNTNTQWVSCCDAHGNITDLLDADGILVAHHNYDPYGNAAAQSGDGAILNSFRFSMKYYDPTIDACYYGFRYYSSMYGRWLSRDPAGETGRFDRTFRQGDGPREGSSLCENNVISWMKERNAETENPYHFVWNNPVTKWDYLGLKSGFFNRGRCCNISSHDEWALVAVGTNCPAWRKLVPGQCVGGKIGNLDCEGMTCGGGFYMVSGKLLGGGHCLTPGYDHGPFKKLRWTPSQKDIKAKAPSERTH